MKSQSTQKPDIHSLAARFQRLSVASLGDGPHYDIFARAIKNVLSTEISEITLAQIADGLPLSTVEKDTYSGSGYLCGDHPLHEKHKQLCPGVLKKTRELYADFDVNSLQISSRLLHKYKISSPGSRAFQISLIELAASSIHQVAVQLFKLDTSFHKDNSIAKWEPAKDHPLFWILNPDGVPLTLFQHRQYRYYDQYPDGIADGVGYWAESRIFGGVVLFDRREPSSADDVDLEGVYLHPDRKNMTYRIYRLLDSQKLELVQFLLSDTYPPRASPLPILGDENNRWRVDPEESVETTGIYRDLWERKPLGRDELDRRLRDAIDRIDFPTDADLYQAQERAEIRRERNWHEE